VSRRTPILIELPQPCPAQVPWSEQKADHDWNLQRYLHTFRLRNFSNDTRRWSEQFITGFFGCFIVQDPTHSSGVRNLLLWDLLNPKNGSTCVSKFAEALMAAGLKLKTRHKYLKEIKYCCEFVLAHPELPNTTDEQAVITKYGPIKQPVSKYLCPPHAPDADEADRHVLSRVQRDSFYEFIRSEYLPRSRWPHIVGRDLTMIELAWGSGFRISELIHAHSKGDDRDVDYVNGRIRTRWGKGAKCRGKKTRWSILTPRTRIVLQGYEAHIRPTFPQAESRPELFLSSTSGPMSYQECWIRLAKIVKAARQAGVNLPSKVRWHDLRRTFATLFLEDNPDQFWLLMKLMGHSARGTMSSYVLIDEDTFQYTLGRVLNRDKTGRD
jgi:site-specific recombinase XerD